MNIADKHSQQENKVATTVKQENRYSAMVKRQADAVCDERRIMEILSRPRAPRAPTHRNHSTTATRKQVRSWMRRNAEQYDYCLTMLTEAANVALELPAGAMDDGDHWIWDEAYDACEDQQ